MAAPTAPQHGIEFLLKAGGNLIGGGMNATLTQSTNTVDTTTKDENLWAGNTAARRSWELSSENVYVESSSKITGLTGTFSVGISSDGGTSYNDLNGLVDATLNLSMDQADKTSADTGDYTDLSYNTRNASLDVSTRYHDPAGTGATAEADLQDALDATTSDGLVDVKLSFGASAEYVFTAVVTEGVLDTPAGDIAGGSYTLTAEGAVTDNSTSADAGLAALTSAFFGDPPTSVTALLEVQQAGSSTSTVTGATQYTGDAWVTDFSITIPENDNIDASATLTGAGALTVQTQ